jgi:hypothetical protein
MLSASMWHRQLYMSANGCESLSLHIMMLVHDWTRIDCSCLYLDCFLRLTGFTFQQAIVRCTLAGWQTTAVTALDPTGGPNQGTPVDCGTRKPWLSGRRSLDSQQGSEENLARQLLWCICSKALLIVMQRAACWTVAT